MTTPTIIVETAAGTAGAGTTGANSYIALTDAITYFSNRGDTVFTKASTAAQSAALVRACSGLDYWLNGRWLGRRASGPQPLDWPRVGVCDSDGYLVPKTMIPPKVQYAQCEVAKIELTTPFIQQSVSRDDSIQDERVGPINISYKNTAPSVTYWPQVIAMLRDYAQIGIMPIEVVIGLSERERRASKTDHHGFGMNPFDFPDYFHLIKEAVYNPGYDADWLI